MSEGKEIVCEADQQHQKVDENAGRSGVIGVVKCDNPGRCYGPVVSSASGTLACHFPHSLLRPGTTTGQKTPQSTRDRTESCNSDGGADPLNKRRNPRGPEHRQGAVKHWTWLPWALMHVILGISLRKGRLEGRMLTQRNESVAAEHHRRPGNGHMRIVTGPAILVEGV